MTDENNAKDPLEFLRNMWSSMGFSLPGMVTPTIDVDELDKRIMDMKAVEQWLKMNLNMLQMSTHGLEMQRATLAAVKAMSLQGSDDKSKSSAAGEQADNPFAQAMMWPWNLMNSTTLPEVVADPADAGKAQSARSSSTRKATGSGKSE